MHTPEAESQNRDGIRKFLLEIAEHDCIDLDVVDYVAAAATRKAGNAWLTRQETLGNLPCIGKRKANDGRTTIKVYCRTKYKEDNLRHHVIGTFVRLLYPSFTSECEPGAAACFCDRTLVNGDHTYEVEIECGTLKQQKFKYRTKRHKCQNDILFIVAPKVGNPETRLKTIMEWSDAIADRAFFTTLERLQTHGPHARVWDFIGREENEPMKCVKLPVFEAVQKYVRNTAETAAISEENEESDEQD